MFRAHVVYVFLFLGHQYSISLLSIDMHASREKILMIFYFQRDHEIFPSCFSEDDSESVLQKNHPVTKWNGLIDSVMND